MGYLDKVKENCAFEKAERDNARNLAKEMKREFSATKRLSDIEIDERHELLKIKRAIIGLFDKIYTFDDIMGYELIEDDETVSSGGLGAAALGAITFGPAGAIVGAVVGAKKQKKFISNLVLKIGINDFNHPCVMISYVNKKVLNTSREYRRARNAAQKTMSCLDAVMQRQGRTHVGRHAK